MVNNFLYLIYLYLHSFIQECRIWIYFFLMIQIQESDFRNSHSEFIENWMNIARSDWTSCKYDSFPFYSFLSTTSFYEEWVNETYVRFVWVHLEFIIISWDSCRSKWNSPDSWQATTQWSVLSLRDEKFGENELLSMKTLKMDKSFCGEDFLLWLKMVLQFFTFFSESYMSK